MHICGNKSLGKHSLCLLYQYFQPMHNGVTVQLPVANFFCNIVQRLPAARKKASGGLVTLYNALQNQVGGEGSNDTMINQLHIPLIVILNVIALT